MDFVPKSTNAMRDALQGFVNDLTNSLRNRDTMLTINHNALRRRIDQAKAALADDLAAEVAEEAGEPCAFAHCPPGLFRYAGMLCFKSEYSSKPGQQDAYCVDSGEYFWGGTNGDLGKRRSLMVTPVIAATPPAPADASGEVERLRGELRRIAEGNLGDHPWQASYARIKEIARTALHANAGSPPADVIALVLAGRAVIENDGIADREAGHILDKAHKAFSARVCYDDEGGDLSEAHADPCTCGRTVVP